MKRIHFAEESYKIMGAIYKVHREKGSGFLEPVYHECLIKEFLRQKLPAVSEPELDLYYKGELLTQKYKPDFVYFGKIIVEIKAVKELTDAHRAQIINYLKVTSFELGLLINFGTHPKVQEERFLNLPSKENSK